MQEWYGKGKFIDKGNKRTLYFLEADSTYNWVMEHLIMKLILQEL